MQNQLQKTKTHIDISNCLGGQRVDGGSLGHEKNRISLERKYRTRKVYIIFKRMQTAAALSTDAVTVHKWSPAYPVAQRYVIKFCGF